MPKSPKLGPAARKAVDATEKLGACLVFPIDNRPEPKSLWSVLHPRTPMRWEWDEDGDDRVARLWHLRVELSVSGAVVYGKWFRGRATFFSCEAFTWLLAARRTAARRNELSLTARQLLDALEDSSPLSTKQLKKATGLVGKIFESSYVKSLKELWEAGWIVAYGEVDDGAFPSLAVGATSLIFEPLWKRARDLDPAAAEAKLRAKLGEDSLMWREFEKQNGRPASPRVARQGTVKAKSAKASR